MARPRAAKITKPASNLSSTNGLTRHRSRLASSSSSNAGLQHMIDEVWNSRNTPDSSLSCDQMEETIDWDFVNQYGEDEDYNVVAVESQESFDSTFPPRDKGKGRLIEVETDYRPFPIMELPAEIRLEIYRACLTRPRKIMLSKIEKPSQPEQRAAEGYQPPGTDSSGAGNVLEMHEQSREGYRIPLDMTALPPQAIPPVNSVSNSRLIPSNRLRMWVSRNNRSSRSNLAVRSPSTSASVSTPANPASLNNAAGASRYSTLSTTNNYASARRVTDQQPLPNRPKSDDPLVVNILRASKQIYKEARDVLYSENVFDLDVSTAVSSLAALHQRSRRHIKHVELEIPTYTEILERFSEVVRLSLRYCAGLKTFIIHTPFTLPGADGNMAASNTTVYANGFDILRWLPQQCHVILEGSHNPEIDAVVNKHLNLAKTQDKVAYARRQLISNESERPLGP